MIKLFINLFLSTNLTRAQEYLTSLVVNTTLVALDKIYVLQDGEVDERFRYHHKKIEYLRVDKRYTYLDFFEFINKNTKDDDINILGNSDVIFDYTIKEVYSITHKECYALCRWDGNGPVPFGYGSQDSWIFRGKITIPKYCDFFLGIPGCDNRIAWELKEVGYLMSNPSLSIRNFHIHESDFRTYNEATVKIPQPYLYINPKIHNNI